VWLTLLFAGTACLFLAMACSTLYHLRWVQRLPQLESAPAPSDPADEDGHRTRCSVVLAARDEEARIEQTIRHLLAQRGVDIEVIAVDDRSIDRTSEILRQLAVEDARVRPRRVDALAEGWLGKCHACHVGAAAASGDWILFTDADCWLKPDVIARAVRAAERNGADHVVLTPGVARSGLGVDAWHLLFLVSLADWMAGVNRDRPKAYFGIGAFNLVRADAYRGCGGYEALRLTVLDDFRLGLLLRRAGKRSRAFLGEGDVECHWGATLRAMIKIMEKNYFAAVDFRLAPAIGLGVGGTLLWCVAAVGPFTGNPAGIASGLALLSTIVPAAILARRLGWSLAPAALTPLIYPVLFYAILNSTLLTVRRGGVRWRDTFYPLATLRKYGVR
jgi:cellulose synthase/poly-beta-1,6-N-acetylglucosamine synthase-like glycosyltransferase